MLDAVRPHQPLSLLHDLQAVMTIVNHDMLHHFTSPYIGDRTAKKFVSGLPDDFSDWERQIPYSGNGEAYEDWAQIGHEKTVMSKESRLLEDLDLYIGHYFDELKRVGDEIKRTAADAALGEKRAHEVVDFFGTLMAHALTRILPLNHPLMALCLDKMEGADPCPQEILNAATREAARDALKYRDKTCTDSYRELGLEIMPAADSKVGYKNVKLAHLVAIAQKDVNAHIPAPLSTDLAGLRGATDRVTLDMIRVAALTTNYKPL